MMLELFDPDRHVALAESRISEVRAVKVYYVTSGRNAWHSTWVKRYSPGCMHVSIDTAKEQSERMRKQGSVFVIREQPAVAGISTVGAVIATQINTPRPLAAYSQSALSGAYPAPTLESATDNYLVKGAPMLGFAQTFEWGSQFWRARQPVRDSIFLLALNRRDVELEALSKAKSNEFVSRSVGPKFYFHWAIRTADVEVVGTEVFDLLLSSQADHAKQRCA